MRIKSAEFVISVADSAKLPHFGAPEIAFAGFYKFPHRQR